MVLRVVRAAWPCIGEENHGSGSSSRGSDGDLGGGRWDVQKCPGSDVPCWHVALGRKLQAGLEFTNCR
jgi:hypothetical protein